VLLADHAPIPPGCARAVDITPERGRVGDGCGG